MASCYLSLDPSTKQNGCLQVLRASHALGRIDHDFVSTQVGADPRRIEALLERLELVHVELPAGGAVFFHCNTLHRSDANESDSPRWGLICCYNTKHNEPAWASHHPGYSPIERVPTAELLRCPIEASRAFLSTTDDGTVPDRA